MVENLHFYFGMFDGLHTYRAILVRKSRLHKHFSLSADQKVLLMVNITEVKFILFSGDADVNHFSESVLGYNKSNVFNSYFKGNHMFFFHIRELVVAPNIQFANWLTTLLIELNLDAC
jgi:hypothetical protein